MELRKCTQCGGNLNRLHTRRIWVCPFCGAKYEDEVKEDLSGYCGLNSEVFKVETDLSKVMAKNGGSGCIRTIAHCMDTCETAAQVEEYMRRKLPFSDDISLPGVREDQIEKAMPAILPLMEPGERVIVYGNKGILSKGKEYFVITDKRVLFADRNKVKFVLHTDLDMLKIEDCGNCTVNGDYGKCIVDLDGKGLFQGALIALMCLLSFEAMPDRGRIRIV